MFNTNVEIIYVRLATVFPFTEVRGGGGVK